MAETLPSDLLAGGPGVPPSPWVIKGNTVSYDGAVLVPSYVEGGFIEQGSINANAFYIKGVQLVNPVGLYLPLTGGALTGPLTISGPPNFVLGGGVLGQCLVTNGAGVLSWSSAPPGGPYLKLTGGTLSGLLTIPTLSLFSLGGGTAGQTLSTDGAGHLQWITPTGFSIFDAPSDGTFYGRVNANWVNPTHNYITDWNTFFSIGATPPTVPIVGSLWWDAVGGQLYIYYNDGTSSQWVVTSNTQGLTDAPANGNFYGRQNNLWQPVLSPAGGTLTGPLVLAADPTVALGAATKQYADTKLINGNKIINGDMWIDQRNAGVAGTAVGYTCDRWQFASTLATKGTWQRVTAGAGLWALGFSYYLMFTSNSAYTPLAAGDYFCFYQSIEADYVTDFAWGTPGAQPATLSFIVNSTIAGTFSGSVRNAAANRSYVFTYTIPVASVWTKIVVNIPADPTGTWVLNGNAASLGVFFCYGIGTTLAGPANAWSSANYVGAAGTVNIAGTNGASFILTAVKLETGPIATPFPQQTLAKKWADCERYYQLYQNHMLNLYNGAGVTVYGSWTLRTYMRASPTAAYSGINYANASGLATWTISPGAFGVSYVVTAAGNAYCYFTARMTAEI